MFLKRSHLYGVLITWTAATSIFPTAIVYRGAVEPRYEWGLFGITGVGASPGYAVVVAAAVWVWRLVVLGQRHSPAFAPAALGWNGFLFLSLLLGVREWGSEMVLRGDALGVRINLAILGPVLSGAMLLASLALLRLERPKRANLPRVLPPRYRIVLGAALALTPIILTLFGLSPGAEHTDLDRVAAVLTIAQCITVAYALGGYRTNRDPAPA